MAYRYVVHICVILQLVEMEAMLSGAPDAFILVTKQWMNIKKLVSSDSYY